MQNHCDAASAGIAPCHHVLQLYSTHCCHECTGTESAGKLGKFLVQAQFQGSVHSSALFLTAAAQNLLCLKLATEMGVVIASPWVTWLKGALAPALVGLLVTPFLMYKVSIGSAVLLQV